MAFFLVLVSALFYYVSLDWIATFRASHTYLLLVLPALALLLVAERRISRFRLSSREEVKGVTSLTRPAVSFWAGVLLVSQSLLVHLVGGSVGREGVGIQLGAWAARWAEAPRWYRAGCIATGISVIFGAPVTATAFIFETALVQKKRLNWKEIIAVPLMAIGADLIVRALGVRHFSFPQYDFSSLQQLLNFKSGLVILMFVLLVTSFSALFLVAFSWVASKVPELSDRRLFIVSAAFLMIFMPTAFYFGEQAGLTGLGAQSWSWLYNVDRPQVATGLTLLLLAFLKVVFTAGFSGLGFKGGEVTPMLAVGSFVGVFLSSMPVVATPIVSIIGFSAVWGVSARRPLVAAALGYECFGGAAVFAGVLTYLSLKLGDIVFKSPLFRYEKVRDAWHRGLYD